jgi:hypothetical protein
MRHRKKGLRRRYGHSSATGWAAKLRALNLKVRRMPGGRWSVFAVRTPTFYHTFGPGSGAQTQAINWAWHFGHGRAKSPYGQEYIP